MLHSIQLKLAEHQVSAIIGPSGCGKSTVLRSLNRMHDLIPGSQVNGRIILDGKDIYAASVDLVDPAQRVGMVFQKPNPFPACRFMIMWPTGQR